MLKRLIGVLSSILVLLGVGAIMTGTQFVPRLRAHPLVFSIQHSAGRDLVRIVERQGYVSEDCRDLTADELLAISVAKVKSGVRGDCVSRYRIQGEGGVYGVEVFWVYRTREGWLTPSTETYFSCKVPRKPAENNSDGEVKAPDTERGRRAPRRSVSPNA